MVFLLRLRRFRTASVEISKDSGGTKILAEHETFSASKYENANY